MRLHSLNETVEFDRREGSIETVVLNSQGNESRTQIYILVGSLLSKGWFTTPGP
jgi:hypothetical protein